MLMQNLIVLSLVAGSLAYALWTLMPAALRQGLARKLLPLAPNQAWLQKAARQAGGCGGGDGGCSACGDGGTPKIQTIKIHRR